MVCIAAASVVFSFFICFNFESTTEGVSCESRVSRASANPAFTKPGRLVTIISVEQRGKQQNIWFGLL